MSVKLQQLQEHELQLKEELDYARRNNETLSHRMTELTQAAYNVSQIKSLWSTLLLMKNLCLV